MPQSIEKMIVRTRTDEKSVGELILKETLSDAPRPHINSRLKKCMIRIYDEIKPFMIDPENPYPYAPAHAFEHLKDEFSRPTVVKAKKLLGIRSFKIERDWVWTFPSRGPTEAEDEMNQSYLARWHKDQIELHPIYKRARNLHRPSTRRLAEAMRAHHYDCLGKWVLVECGFSAQVVKRAKAALGVVSVKRHDGWHWVYAAPEVQGWLVELLGAGARTIEEVVALAALEKGWSRDVVEISRMACRGIVFAAIALREGEPREPGWRLI